MKNIIIFSCLLTAMTANAIDRLNTGFGAVVTATNGATELNIEGAAGNDTVLNGAFADETQWTTTGTVNGGCSIQSGVLRLDAVDTSSTGTCYEAQAIVPGKTYRVKYTLAAVAGPAKAQVTIGTANGTVRSANGTYTEDITAGYDVSSSTNLMITLWATNIAATCTVDNVSCRLAPPNVYADNVYLSVGATNVPAYVLWNCNTTVFSNMYNDSRCFLITSNMAPVRVGGTPNGVPIEKILYRAADTTFSTLYINAN